MVRIPEPKLENKFSLSHLLTPANCISGGASCIFISSLIISQQSLTFYCSNLLSMKVLS